MHRMKYIFYIVFFNILFFSNGFGQIDRVDNFAINKHSFNPEDDTIKIYLEIYKKGFTDKEKPDSTIRCKAVLQSSVQFLKSEYLGTKAEFEFEFFKKTDDKQAYTLSIPVQLLNRGRYSLDIMLADNYSTTYYSVSRYNIYPEPVSIGDWGVTGITGNFDINGNEYRYSFMDFNYNTEPLPEELAGDYLSGFCSDELITLKNFLIHLWQQPEDKTPEITLYYSLDNEAFATVNNASLLDDSSDGKLVFDDSVFNYSFYSNEKIKDVAIDMHAGIRDIINLLKINNTGYHNLEIYFTFDNGKEILRIPETENFNVRFKVADAPRGADCQAELLPIDLLDFDVIKKEKSVHLKWTTREEINNDYFEIQKSTDTKKWNNIVKIKGKGNDNSFNHYEYTDIFPLPGISYYRLRQTDYNGAFKYSKVKVIYNFENKLKIFPNPAHNYLYYTILDPNQKYKIEIFNNQGQLLKTELIPATNTYKQRIDVTHLNKGIYFLKYINLSNYRVNILTFVKN